MYIKYEKLENWLVISKGGHQIILTEREDMLILRDYLNNEFPHDREAVIADDSDTIVGCHSLGTDVLCKDCQQNYGDDGCKKVRATGGTFYYFKINDYQCNKRADCTYKDIPRGTCNAEHPEQCDFSAPIMKAISPNDNDTLLFKPNRELETMKCSKCQKEVPFHPEGLCGECFKMGEYQ
jgi:hypothetical protein